MDYAIVLSDNLIKELYEFKSGGDYNNQTIQKLFNYYKSPYITNITQLKRVGIKDSSLYSKLIRANLTNQTLLELSDKSKFKVILNQDIDTYPYININSDRLENNYSATFYKDEPRTKAQEHIKALLKDAKNIFIYDKYIDDQWSSTREFFTKLLPRKPLTIFYKEKHLSSIESDIKKIYPKWKIKKDMSNHTHTYLHDRYLIIDSKIEIILTSGFDYLFDKSRDFTYIVRKI